MSNTDKGSAKSDVAYAKVNLALHVRERMLDGYHRLETIFAFCDHGDLLSIEPSDRLSLEIRGPFAGALAGESDNLILEAARGAGSTAAFTLDKRLPVAAGIGGGSADAAAALRLMGRGDDHSLARKLGADVPACLASRSARGGGRGDVLVPVDLPDVDGRPVLLVNPGVPLSTRDVFAAWDGIDRGPLADWRSGRNDLEPAARRLVPQIDEVLQALDGAVVARMSGSGATCFGLFETDLERGRLAAEIRQANPEWWICQTRFRSVSSEA